MKTKEKELIDLKNELVACLNDECPKCFPPLEPYTTADLSHSFAESLRIRLDEITIKRGELSALESQPEQSQEGEQPEKTFENILLEHLKLNKVYFTSNEIHTIWDAMEEYRNQPKKQ